MGPNLVEGRPGCPRAPRPAPAAPGRQRQPDRRLIGRPPAERLAHHLLADLVARAVRRPRSARHPASSARPPGLPAGAARRVGGLPWGGDPDRGRTGRRPAARRPARRPHPADLGPGPGGALRHPGRAGRADRRPRAGPLRRLRRGRPGGRLPRRRGRPAGRRRRPRRGDRAGQRRARSASPTGSPCGGTGSSGSSRPDRSSRRTPRDLAFADPPYALPDAELDAALALLTGRGWLAPGAVVVVERASRGAGPTWPDGLQPVKSRRYGEGTLWYGRLS